MFACFYSFESEVCILKWFASDKFNGDFWINIQYLKMNRQVKREREDNTLQLFNVIFKFNSHQLINGDQSQTTMFVNELNSK